MKSIEIKGELRTSVGKKESKKLRNEEKVPCVLYGGEENVHFAVSEKELKSLIFTPNVYLVDIDIDSKKKKAIIQDLQFHPVTDRVIHIDFFEIFEDKEVVINIPVEMHGLAEGVEAGGKLQVINRKLKVKALFKNLPDVLEVNVEKVALGKNVKVGDLSYDNLELLNSANTVVATVKLTRAAKGMELDEEGEGEEGETVEGEEGATEEAEAKE
ncbi:MAG: 50S ribosomal protein L25 [Bacteroidetes bacterium]|nr:MAG: 50S ribosomal protein L25 [Bacteroidota bacterium]